jgi:hypothetical protein
MAVVCLRWYEVENDRKDRIEDDLGDPGDRESLEVGVEEVCLWTAPKFVKELWMMSRGKS